jgi:hypothetical protein
MITIRCCAHKEVTGHPAVRLAFVVPAASLNQRKSSTLEPVEQPIWTLLAILMAASLT